MLIFEDLLRNVDDIHPYWLLVSTELLLPRMAKKLNTARAASKQAGFMTLE